MQATIAKYGTMVDRFHLMTVFVAVAEAQSFAGAARRLKMSAPAVTRAVSGLEERLGVRLLTRTTRVVRVTEAGARYLEDARRLMVEFDEADAAAAGINATPRGQLALTAPVLFGKLYVMPVITEYQTRFESVSVSALFVDRVVNIVDEGMDVGVRIGPLPDSSLRAVKVGRVRRVVVGAPSYLLRNGIPQTPDDLKAHALIAASGITPTNDWPFRIDGERRVVRTHARLQVSTNDGALEAARLGHGLTRLLSYQVAPQLESGELRTVLENFEEEDLPVHVVHRESRHGSAKVRSFIDLAIARLRENKALN
jgi:DNA-binding transcriptional LysR family regulator